MRTSSASERMNVSSVPVIAAQNGALLGPVPVGGLLPGRSRTTRELTGASIDDAAALA